MRAVHAIVVVSVFAAACGDNSFGLDADSSRRVFDKANQRIHLTHVEMGELEEWPVTYETTCDEGGTIAVTTTFSDGAPFGFGTLLHTYDRCLEDGWVIGGEISYFDFDRCEDDTFTFTIEGRLELEGYEPCTVAAVETCGAITGKACGHSL